MISTWTPEREATLRRMWGRGESAAKIARELGGVTRNAVIGMIHRLGLGRTTAAERSEWARQKPKPKTRAKVVCAVQGCGKVLSKKNMSGVCKDHAHVPGRCQCLACIGGAVARRAAAVERPDVRVATVPRFGTSTSGGEAILRVSLKREPWLSP